MTAEECGRGAIPSGLLVGGASTAAPLSSSSRLRQCDDAKLQNLTGWEQGNAVSPTKSMNCRKKFLAQLGSICWARLALAATSPNEDSKPSLHKRREHGDCF